MKKILITAIFGFGGWSFLALPATAMADNNCLQWSQSICRDMGVVRLSCGYTGPAIYTKGLVINKTPLQRKGFRLGSGSYTMVITRIDKERYIIGVNSLSDPSRYQEKEVIRKR